jgi:hypothetical protein
MLILQKHMPYERTQTPAHCLPVGTCEVCQVIPKLLNHASLHQTRVIQAKDQCGQALKVSKCRAPKTNAQLELSYKSQAFHKSACQLA